MATFTASAQSVTAPAASTASKVAKTHKQVTGSKAIVVAYLDAVFNQRNLAKAETYWAGNMIQHNPSMPNGLGVLRDFISSNGPSPTYEPGLVMEEGNLVMIHGRYRNWFGKTMIAVDIFRLENGKVVEHWDVMQEEVPAEKSANGNAMFPAK
ncbi:MAG: hypothetical protein DI603_07005 [Roseateles depolymerans]|uniref:SnoaL-like domain-containing protein n=1 Tax=Roseateles depolymerans TaxID=76731 RepID=A0A2W5FLY7_9BURK|nr:MAG: hypothetical protein DI603_07005 [Roseateles depolymerans]